MSKYLLELQKSYFCIFIYITFQLIFRYIEAALSGTNESIDDFWEQIESVDKCILSVFKDYLDYLEQWVLLNKTKFQKNLLEEEFSFCEEISLYVYLIIMIKKSNMK